ncbi:MAG: hypothetical protein JRN21_06010 [Nitrososphaerota archaeon]|nr:hypothetical protein [Nitrososphaerota archaeon]
MGAENQEEVEDIKETSKAGFAVRFALLVLLTGGGIGAVLVVETGFNTGIPNLVFLPIGLGYLLLMFSWAVKLGLRRQASKKRESGVQS